MNMEMKIRAIMKATGQKQQALAEHFMVSQSTVHRWLKGAEPEGPHRDAINDLHDKVIGEPERNGQQTLIRGDAEILAVLKRIEGLTETDIDVAFAVITKALAANQAAQGRSGAGDRSPPETPAHVSVPSLKR